MKHRLPFIIIFVLTFLAQVQARQPILRNFSPAEMSGGTQTWDMTQLPDGRMLFANNSGLLVYDGSSWSVFAVPNGSPVRSVHYDNKSRRIYIGASLEFGYFEQQGHSQLKYHSLVPLLKAKEKNIGEVWHIFALGDEVVFQTSEQLIVFNTQRNHARTLHLPEHMESAARIGNKIYLGGVHGVYVFERGRLARVNALKSLGGSPVKAIIPFGRNILFATLDNGFFLFDGQHLTPYQLDITPALMHHKIFTATLRHNLLVVGTIRDGVYIKNLVTGAVYHSNVDDGLQNNTVLAIGFDRTKNIWLGLDNGATYLMQNLAYANLLNKQQNVGTGYASVLLGHQLYLGTNQGLFFMNYPSANNAAKPLPVNNISGQVWSLQSMGNHLLVGADKGSYVVRNNQAQRIDGPQGTWNFCPIPGKKGWVMGSDYRGFFLLMPIGDGYRCAHGVQGIAFGTPEFLFDSDGTMWLSAWQNGVYHLWFNKDYSRVVRKEYFGLHHGLATNNNIVNKLNGQIVVSSTDGFYRYNRHTRRLERDMKLTNMVGCYGKASKLLQMPDGNFWALAGDFVGLVKKQRGRWVIDSLTFNGMKRQIPIGLGRHSVLNNEQTIINSISGFFLVNNRQKTPKVNYPLIIKQVEATGTDSVLYSEMSGDSRGELVIPHSLNSIKIEFVMPEYRADNAVTYQCYLEHYDAGWSSVQKLNQKEYTRLGKGTYIFHLRATNLIDGTVKERTLTLRILPAWYETWWAYLIYIALIVVAFRFVLKLMNHRADRELRRLEKEKELQLRQQQATFEAEREKKEKEMVKLRNQKLEMELKHKASEMADSTMNIVRKNDILMAIDAGMDELSAAIRKDTDASILRKKIIELRKEIRLHQQDDDNWDKFEQNFNLVYDNFTQHLVEAYPSLKLNDIKLCAYLKMGLSSKEIAALMNTAVRSVETARYRLRRKMNLDNGENLADFIQKMK